MREAERNGWSVLCEDESIFLYDSVSRYVWTKRGSRPLVMTTGSHRRTCLFGTISLNRKQLFRQYSTVNGKNFLNYMTQLKRRFSPLLIFIDRSAPHQRDRQVQRWLCSNRNTVKVRWFPKARPELNPVEECWNQSREIIQANRIHPTFEAMKKEISKTLRTKRFKLDIVKYLC